MIQKRERNNKGFTLVELLVAITVLAIIVVPFMQGFVTAARTNMKAKKLQNATMIATNAMEKIKANSFEDFEFIREADGKSYYMIKGVQAEGHTFDTLITLDTNEYVDPYTEGYNEMKVPIISTPDVLTDAFYIQANDLDNEYGEKFLVQFNSTTNAMTVKELFDGNYNNDEVGRQIVIDVEKSGAVTQVYITYTYTYYAKVNGTVTAMGTKGFERELMYDNAEGQTNELSSVYLFYKPLYGSKLSNAIDKIKINNVYNIPLNIYIVKQRQTTVDSVAMSTKEAEYYCEVEIQDDSKVNVGSNERSCMTIRTNLGANLYREDIELNNQYIIRYSTNAALAPTYSANNKRVLGVTGLNGEEQKERIYAVTISVYEEGEADNNFEGEPFIEITGSTTN